MISAKMSGLALALVGLTVLILLTQRGSAKGIEASPVNTSRYFTNGAVAAFAEEIQKGNLAKVKAALQAGMDPNAVGREGFRPIFFVFPANNADVARALLKAGADPNAKLDDGTPPLFYAVRLGNPAFTEALLDFKADPNATGPNEIPVIHEATLADAPDNIKLLVRAGADINVVWGSGTPLYAAISAGCWECATTLLDLGANTAWESRSPRGAMMAADNLCKRFDRLRPTPTNRKPILDLFAAFERRGVKVTCSADAERFR